MSRRLCGLKWARQIERPGGIPKGRPRGAKAAGVRYERALAAALPEAHHGLWWEYLDDNGMGFCQTDLLLLGPDCALVLECKYTWTEEAWEQLEHLYLPVVARALDCPTYGVQVCKTLRGETSDVCWTLEEALAIALEGRRPSMHWTMRTRLLGPWGRGAIGRSPIGACPPTRMPPSVEREL